RLLFIPWNQNIDYDYHIVGTLAELPVLASFVLIILILSLAIKMLPKYRLLSFGIFFFFLALMPESSIIPIADVIFEHRLYLPMAGYSIFLAGAVYYIFARRSRRAMNAAIFIIILLYSALTYGRNLVWADGVSLWSDAAHKSPDKGRPYNNRGFAYLGRQDPDSAIKDFNKAIELEPGSDAGYYYNLANAYRMKGMQEEAVSNYSKAVEIDPLFTMAYIQRAVTYFNKGDYDNSLKDMRKVEGLGCAVPASFREKLEKMMKKSR
ncbi:MAG: tetratricopeptide repeat protein, partial [Candidatus Omnitrophica bacterium]|nr:tetratricopeptide repeat protein [Candidatus Omnitrophota bacterium]